MDALAELVRDYLSHLSVERGLSANTIAAYRRDLRRYGDHLAQRGIMSPGEIAPSDISDFQQSLAEGDAEHPPLAPASVARTIVAVRNLHRFAASEVPGTIDPSTEIAPPKLARHLPKALSLSQVQALLDSCDRSDPLGLRDALLLELLYGTGGRVSEIVGLDVDELTHALADPDAGLRLIGKGDKERWVPLGSFAREAAQAWLVRGRPVLASKGKATPALLLNTRGARLSRQSAWQVLRECASRAGIETAISPHSLRHSFATHLLDGGADVRVVQELLGHASVTTTQIYTMVTVDHLREVYLASHPRAY
ncbi:MAG TPA: site-specific tyrosine recombinase XerD [Propionibacteriaceae bacterium]|nr:site-specific tyrosine recombinase XerD [Propionibacteriaceae bacterium]